MSDTIQAVLAGLGTFGVMLAISCYWFQKYVIRAFESRFKLLEARLVGELETTQTLRKLRLQRTAEILPELQKTASECRNSLQRFRQGTTDESEVFQSNDQKYVDYLYASQLFLPPDLYEAAHGLKRAYDTTILILGAPTSPDDPALCRSTEEIDRLYPKLSDGLRNLLQSLENVGK